MIQAEYVALPADQVCVECVVALYFADQRPLDGPAAVLDWRLDGQLTKMLVEGCIKGRAGEHVLLQGNGKVKAEWVLFVGGGKWQGLCAETHAALICHMLTVARNAGFRDLALLFAPHEDVDRELLHQQLVAALATSGEGVRTCCFASCNDLSV